MKMIRHSARMAAVILLMVLIMVYPFLPGQYHALAMPLSTVVQLLATVGLLLVPLGALWLVYELRQQARRNRNLLSTNRGYSFALISLIVASILVILISLFTSFGIGLSLGVFISALWSYALSRLIPGLKLIKKAESESINPTPFYLIVLSHFDTCCPTTFSTNVCPSLNRVQQKLRDR